MASRDRTSWGFAVAALIAGVLAVAIVVLLILGFRGAFGFHGAL